MTTELAEILQAQADATLEDKKTIVPSEDMDADEAFANWYLKQMDDCDMQETRIKVQADILQRQVNARRAYLAYAHGPEFQRIVAAQIVSQPGKKKSVDFAFGRAGWRVKPATLIVEDKEAAVEWAMQNCPDAIDVVIGRRTPLKEYCEKTGVEPPGCKFHGKRDAFYPAVSQKLIDEHREELLRLEGRDDED